MFVGEMGEAQVFIASLLLSKYSFRALFEQIYQLQFFCLKQDNHVSKFLTASSLVTRFSAPQPLTIIVGIRGLVMGGNLACIKSSLRLGGRL